MPDKRIENINIRSEDPLITPEQLKNEHPLNELVIETVQRGQISIKNILQRRDKRLFMVVGPCSIHDIASAFDYAHRLKRLSDKVQDTLVLVMRVYFEKPRTNTGWQGFINDPDLDGSFNIESGLQLARRLLLDIAELGLLAAGEALDLVTPQYIQDLFSWTAIGARTTESQTHRKMASGLSTAVGFKNGTDGHLASAVNAILSASEPSHFISISPKGQSSLIRTKGNPNTHIVLRGGRKGPNYDEESIRHCEEMLNQARVPQNIMVDCSHSNSGKRAAKQLEVLAEVTRQILKGNKSIVGLMMESNINWGKQTIPEDRSLLKYGVSVTDECIDWQTTEEVILELRDRLRPCLSRR